MTTIHYAGVGSRETPKHILSVMTNIAREFQDYGLVLRSGGADGADTAFAAGCLNKQIFVPWKGFNKHPMLFQIPMDAFKIAEDCHPSWQYLKPPVKNLMARNVMQVLGPALNNYSEFVICWTPDGCITSNGRSKQTGGTGQAISVADKFNIPVINLQRPDHYEKIGHVVNNMPQYFNTLDPHLAEFKQLFKE